MRASCARLTHVEKTRRSPSRAIARPRAGAMPPGTTSGVPRGPSRSSSWSPTTPPSYENACSQCALSGPSPGPEVAHLDGAAVVGVLAVEFAAVPHEAADDGWQFEDAFLAVDPVDGPLPPGHVEGPQGEAGPALGGKDALLDVGYTADELVVDQIAGELVPVVAADGAGLQPALGRVPLAHEEVEVVDVAGTLERVAGRVRQLARVGLGAGQPAAGGGERDEDEVSSCMPVTCAPIVATLCHGRSRNVPACAREPVSGSGGRSPRRLRSPRAPSADRSTSPATSPGSVDRRRNRRERRGAPRRPARGTRPPGGSRTR